MKITSYIDEVEVKIDAHKNTNTNDYIYDKYLTNYKYFSKVHKFQFISQGISMEMAYMYMPSNKKK